MTTLQPLIAICGTTGVGKSRLAVELALSLPRVKGEICGKVINADAMQVYEGLDVLTNKLPASEQNGVEHLLMGFKQPGEQYVVRDWVQDAIEKIQKIHEEQKVPIIVGGTSYWIHHLLFPSSLPSIGPSSCLPRSPSPAFTNLIRLLPENLADVYDALPVTPPSAKDKPEDAYTLYSLLHHLDPLMAKRWHWRDTRKVLRNIEIIKENGRPASEVVIDTQELGSTHKYRTLIFWLHADQQSLNSRLDCRVDEMIKQGLLDEVRSVKSRLCAANFPEDKEPDYCAGIFQAIGFKEFYHYVDCAEKDQEVFRTAVSATKLSTRQYARRQIKWIRNKLLPAAKASNESCLQAGGKEDLHIYLLEVTDDCSWESEVLIPAKQIMNTFLSRSELPDPRSLSSTAKDLLTIQNKPTSASDILQSRQRIICPVCTTHPDRPVLIEEGNEWQAHQRSRAHRRNASKQNRNSMR